MANLTIDKLIPVIWAVILLAGCGSPSSDSSNATASEPGGSQPGVSLTSDSDNVAVGGSVTLEWTTSAVSDCQASGGWQGNKGTDGSQIITGILTDSTFVLTCSGSKGDVSDTTSVTVASGETPTLSLSANPVSVAYGGTTTLDWFTANVNNCTASGGWNGTKAVSGTQTFNGMTASTTFVLDCDGPWGSVSDSLVVVVDAPAQSTINLTANPTSVTAGGSTTLSWSGSDISNCTATGGWGGPKATAGTQTINGLASDTTFGLSCTGTSGTVSDTEIVTVTVPQPTVDLTASPASVNPDGSTTLYWSSSEVDSCTAAGAWSGSKPVSGSETINAINSSSQFTLDCSGTSGSASDTVTVTVVTAQVIFYDDFDASPDWQNVGSQKCRFEGDPEPGCNNLPYNYDFLYTTDNNPNLPMCEITSGAGKGSGGKGLRVYDESNGDSNSWGSDCQLARYFPQQYPELWAAYYIRYNSNMNWESGISKSKIFRMGHYNPMVINGTTGTSVFNTNKDTAFGQTTSGLLFLDTKHNSPTSVRFQQSARCSEYKCGSYDEAWEQDFSGTPGSSWNQTLGDDEWHLIEIRMKMDSAVNANDGIVEIYFDGVLQTIRNDVPWRTSGVESNVTGFNMFTIAGNSNNVWAGQTNAEQWMYDVDEIWICTTRCPVPTN